MIGLNISTPKVEIISAFRGILKRISILFVHSRERSERALHFFFIIIVDQKYKLSKKKINIHMLSLPLTDIK